MTPAPIQISEHDWAALQGVLNACLPDTPVWAFGSRARGTAKPYSDLDIAILGEQPLTLEALADLNHALDASDMTIRTDVVDWASTSDSFRRVIEADHVPIHSTPAATAQDTQ